MLIVLQRLDDSNFFNFIIYTNPHCDQGVPYECDK
jgi:Zn-dependent M16 (insulinase) family peptidase